MTETPFVFLFAIAWVDSGLIVVGGQDCWYEKLLSRRLNIVNTPKSARGSISNFDVFSWNNWGLHESTIGAELSTSTLSYWLSHGLEWTEPMEWKPFYDLCLVESWEESVKYLKHWVMAFRICSVTCLVMRSWFLAQPSLIALLQPLWASYTFSRVVLV